MEVGFRLDQIDMKSQIKSGSYLNWHICLCYYNLISVIRLCKSFDQAKCHNL